MARPSQRVGRHCPGCVSCSKTESRREPAAISGHRERKELVGLVPALGANDLPTGKAGASNSHTL